MNKLSSLFISLICASTTASQSNFNVALKLDIHGLNRIRNHVHDVSNFSSPNYGKYMSKSRILSVVRPKNTYIVINYYKKSNIHCIDKAIYLKCTGQYDSFLPYDIKEYVSFIEGVTHKTYSKHIIKENTVADSGYVGREVLLRLYNISKNNQLDCHTQSVGVAEYMNLSGYSNSDLVAGQKLNGVPSKPVMKNHSIGLNNYSDTETALDLQMGAQIASNNSLWYISSSNWLYSWAAEFLLLDNVPNIVSHSWGWAIDRQCTIHNCTNETSSQYVEQVNNMYMLIAARGVTMVVSSGDSGAPGRSDEDCSGQNTNGYSNRTIIAAFPGASPWVVSVGGTYIVESNTTVNQTDTPLCKQGNCANGSVEETVNFDNVGWTAGGGFAEFFGEERPVWQDEAIKGYFSKKLPLPQPHQFNSNSRGGPDVAAIGHNCPVILQGDLQPVDGTSCSSPLFASILSLVNQFQENRGRPKVGLVAPLLYAMWQDDPSTFNDITTGNNWCTESTCCSRRPDGGSDYGYLASKGWDPVTGLGTPNVGKILHWLSVNT
uniref:Peptidase S53 domain-containing protein n=1 Tax=viral metagenome TaxID=1070528 RepID=A0A6C0JA19_9ZZZZ